MSSEEKRRVEHITSASALIFGMLILSYVLLLWLLPTLKAVENTGDTWWIGLVVVLALGGAAGLGFSYQILKFIGAGDIIKRLTAISAETAARCRAEDVSVSPDSDVETVYKLRSLSAQDLIPVVDGDRTLDGVITASDLAAKRGATTARELMTDTPTVAKTTDNLADVLFLMRTTGHDNIPVVNDNGVYSGTITPRLMLEALQGKAEQLTCPTTNV